jgi:phosphoglycerate dehydrogenase-like enzyme
MKLVIYPPVEEARLQPILEAAGDMAVVNADSPDQAKREIADADAFFGKITPELLSAATRLQWVQSPTASLEHYLFPELIEHPCRLSNMRGLFSDVIADHVLGYVLCFAATCTSTCGNSSSVCGGPSAGRTTAAISPPGPAFVSGMDRNHIHLADCTLGVVGVGNIGSEICRRAAGSA